MTRKYGLKIKAKKCQLFTGQVRYSDGTFAADDYRLNPNNIKAVKDQKTKTLGNIRRLLGIVQNFSKTAEPL